MKSAGWVSWLDSLHLFSCCVCSLTSLICLIFTVRIGHLLAMCLFMCTSVAHACLCVMMLSITLLILIRIHIQLLHKLRQHINMPSSGCLLLIWTPGITAYVTDCMHTLHSSQIPGAAEEIQPMLFTESASTPTVSSTPFTLAPPRSCESKSCDFLLWNICWCVLGWCPNCSTLTAFWPLNDTVKALTVEHVCRKKLVNKGALWVTLLHQEQDDFSINIFTIYSPLSSICVNAVRECTFLFSFYRMKTFILVARQSGTVRTKVLPAPEAPGGLPVRLALR